jgi:large subunit ribosomal protein L16
VPRVDLVRASVVAEYYVAEIQPGKVVFEIVGVPEELAREAFRLAAAKLPLRTTFVSRMIGS